MDMLSFQLVREDERPLYEQLYHQIRQEIIEGRLPYGTKLPSKRKLGQFLSLSQTTIELAYQQLVAEGYVESLPRKGFFVMAYEELAYIKKEEGELHPTAEETETVAYDFHPSLVDASSFPFARFRKHAKDIIDDSHQELVSLGHPQGDLVLREEIATYLYHSRGVICSTEQIIVGSGVEQLLPLLVLLLKDHRYYGVEDPGYHSVRSIVESHGRKTVPISVDVNGIVVGQLESSNAELMYVTPAHQFPTGSILSINRRRQLLNWAGADSSRYIIEDDYDSEFRYSGKPIPSLHSMGADKVIYLSTFSKSLMPSLRIGYMVLPKALLKQYQQEFSYHTSSVSRIDQHILTRFMKADFEKHLNRMRKIYRRKLELLTTLLRPAAPSIAVSGDSAGLHVLLTIANGMTEEELIESARRVSIDVYGISQYSRNALPDQLPQIVLGFASLSEEELSSGISLLLKAWKLQ